MFFSPSSEILNTRNPSKISHFCIRPEKFEQLHDVTDVSSVGQEKKKKTFLSRVKKNIDSSSSMKNTAEDYTVQQLSAAVVHSLH